MIELLYDDAAHVLISSQLVWGGLSSAATLIHIHGPAGPGETGPVILTLPVASPTSTTPNLSITAIQGSQLLAGQWYADIHSSDFPSGEVRGAMAPNPSNNDPCICYLGTPDPDSQAILAANENIAPGTQLSATPSGNLSITLVKSFAGATVDVTSASALVSIPSGPGTGTTSFTVLSGGGSFAAYVFGGESFGASNFTILSGSGSFDWGSGDGEFSVTGRVTLAGFFPIVATATGDMSVDFDADEVTIAPDSMAVEIAQAVPAPSVPWLALAAGLLLWVAWHATRGRRVPATS